MTSGKRRACIISISPQNKQDSGMYAGFIETPFYTKAGEDHFPEASPPFSLGKFHPSLC